MEVRIAVPPDQAEAAIRIIGEHREHVTGGVVVPLERAIADLERRIGYRFRDVGLLEHALTHKSKAHEDATGGVVDNESLEFLGDAVLGFVVADLLYREFPHFQEGQKSKAKAALVSTAALAELGAADRARRVPAARAGRGEDRRSPEAGAAGRRLRGRDRGDLSRWRRRGRARLHPRRVARRDRARALARFPARLQVGAAGAPAGARTAACPSTRSRPSAGPITTSGFTSTVRVGDDVLADPRAGRRRTPSRRRRRHGAAPRLNQSR